MEKKCLSKKLIGERIYIKKHELSLAKTMYSYVNEDRERLSRFLPWADYIQSVEDEEEYIKSTHKHWDECSQFDYGIFNKENDIYMGNLGVHTIKWNHNWAEFGYWILGKFEGFGYMSEAVLLLDQHLFEVGFHRVQIKCSDLNSRSEKVPIRCGYQYEGTAREDAIEKGRYRNTKVFSKLSTDKMNNI